VLTGSALRDAVKELFESRRLMLEDVTDALELSRLFGGLVELARNRTHWIVRVREDSPSHSEEE